MKPAHVIAIVAAIVGGLSLAICGGVLLFYIASKDLLSDWTNSAYSTVLDQEIVQKHQREVERILKEVKSPLEVLEVIYEPAMLSKSELSIAGKIRSLSRFSDGSTIEPFYAIWSRIGENQFQLVRLQIGEYVHIVADR